MKYLYAFGAGFQGWWKDIQEWFTHHPSDYGVGFYAWASIRETLGGIEQLFGDILFVLGYNIFLILAILAVLLMLPIQRRLKLLLFVLAIIALVVVSFSGVFAEFSISYRVDRMRQEAFS